MHTYDLQDFLARSTTREYEDTTLAKVLADLPDLHKDGPWLAGGALRRTLLNREPDSDFDFFFRDTDQMQVFAAALEVRGLVKVRETEHHMHYRGPVGGSAPRDIQLIKFAFYVDAESVLDSFDYTICQFVFDGQLLSCGEFSLWDLGRHRLAVHKITFPVSSARRLLKYAQQNFVACSGCLNALVMATANNPELRTDIEYID